MNTEISKEMFNSWKRDLVTKEVEQMLIERAHARGEELLNPELITKSCYERKSIALISSINEIKLLLDTTHYDLTGIDEEEQDDGGK